MPDQDIYVHGFYTQYVPHPTTGEMREIDYVNYSPRFGADKLMVPARVKSLNPGPKGENIGSGGNDQARDMKLAYMQRIWNQIEPLYEAYKKGSEIPETGTPLGAWPGVTTGQADILRKNTIRTVEEVRDMPDNFMNKIPMPGLRDLRDQAKAFLDATDQNKVSSEVNTLRRENEALKERFEAAMAMIEENAKDGPKAKSKANKTVETADSA